MNIEKLFHDKKLLNAEYEFFMSKNLLRRVPQNDELVQAHIEKAKHNMQFFDKNSDDEQFCDWLIVSLYYALYHSVLSLIIRKGYASKNHRASLIFLIKHYSSLKEGINLLNELSIKKDDAELYAQLKEDRHKASYETKHSFAKEDVLQYKIKVIEFIQRVEELVNE